MLLKKCSNWFYKKSTGFSALVCLLIFIVFSSLVLPDQAAKAEIYAGEVGSPDTSFFYTSKELYRFAEAYGAKGRTAYIRARFTFDVIWPIVYLAFLTTAISWLLMKANLHNSKWQILNLIPLIGTAFDFLENGSAALIMARFPQTTRVLDEMTGIFTLLKWVFITGSFIVLFVCIILLFSHRIKTRKNSKQD